MSSPRTSFEPRVPLVLAEEAVDYALLRDHVTQARLRVELSLRPVAQRYATSLDLNEGVPSLAIATALERTLYVNLVRTLVFGYQTVVQELAVLRALRGDRPTLIADEFASVPEAAGPVLRSITLRARGRFIRLMEQAWAALRDDEARARALRDRGLRAAHIIGIEFVSRTLNAGRSLGALGKRPVIHATAPALFAMRSEQLDANTCDACDSLHGMIAQVPSDRYYLLLPPNGCITATIPDIGPRCRGVMVYGDSLDDFLRGG